MVKISSASRSFSIAEMADRFIAVRAFGVYLITALIFFAGDVCRHPTTLSVGTGSDPPPFMWALAWWPHAIMEGTNPFKTMVVYVPTGYNLAWSTTVPALALIASPLTLILGPVVTFNILMGLAPVFAALSAFALCWHITRSFAPSLVGGYLFGFSSYEIGHMSVGHLNLVTICLIPFAVVLCLRRLEGRIGRVSFVALLSLVLILQFGTSHELFATMTVFGAIMLAVALAYHKAGRASILRLVGLLAASYAIAAIGLAPYLYYALSDRVSSYLPGLAGYSGYFSTDLANFVVPTRLTSLGGTLFEPLVDRFSSVLDEHGAYLGIPLIVMLTLSARHYWRVPIGRAVVVTGAIIAVCSLGPILRVLGHLGRLHIPMPWAIFTQLPFLGLALPGRFTVYMALAGAVAAAAWLHEGRVPRRAKIILAAASIAFLLPSVRAADFQGELHVPAFFVNGSYRKHLRPGEITLAVPYGFAGESMLWQALTGMYFRMVGGYLHHADPPELQRWRIVRSLRSGLTFPGYASELRAFLRAYNVQTIIVGGEQQREWRTFFSPLAVPVTEVGGVTLYHLENEPRAYPAP